VGKSDISYAFYLRVSEFIVSSTQDNKAKCTNTYERAMVKLTSLAAVVICKIAGT